MLLFHVQTSIEPPLTSKYSLTTLFGSPNKVAPNTFCLQKVFNRKNEESIRRAYEVYKRMIDEKFATFVTDQLTVRDPYTKKIIYLPKDRIVLNRITPHPPQEPCVQPCEPHELIASSSIQQEPCSQRVCVPAAAPSVELLKVED